MADTDYNYLEEWKKSAKKNKKTTKVYNKPKRKKILGLAGLQTFAVTYKPKDKK
jgi:hypothetical protein